MLSLSGSLFQVLTVVTVGTLLLNSVLARHWIVFQLEGDLDY